MNFFENRYYRTICLLTLFLGNWPYDNSMMKSIRRFVFCGFIFSFMGAQISKFFTAELSFDLCTEIIPTLLFCAISWIKYFNYWFNSDLMKYILEVIKSEWDSLTEPNELRILTQSTEEARLYNLCIICLCYTGCFIILLLQYIPNILDVIVPLNESRPNHHLFPAEYFVNSREYFYPIVLHMQISVLLGMTAIISSDTILIITLFHMCGMFNIVGYRLEHLFDKGVQTNFSIDETSVFCKRIVNVAKYHRKILGYMHLVVPSMTPFYVAQLILIMITLVSLLLQLNKALMPIEDIGHVVMTTFRILAHYVILFFNIIPAQKITNSGSDIFFKAYCGDWYTAPLKAQKLLLFLMQNFLEPYKLSLGNIITSTFEVFLALVKMTFSYFTIFHSMQQ